MSASERRIDELEADNRRLRALLAIQMRIGEELEVSAIVTPEGVPTVDLRWDTLGAQLTPEQARDLAMNILSVTGWAEQDAVMLRGIRDVLGLDERAQAGFMAMMREARGGDSDRSG